MNTTKSRMQQMGQAAAPEQPDTLKYWFVYSIANFGGSTNTVANAATAVGSVQIQSDSDFLLQALCAVGRSAAGTVLADAVLDVTLQITDLGSGVNLFDQAQQIRCIAGDAKLPFILPTPRILPANSALSATIVNNSGGNLLLQLSLHGRKIFGLR